jgi:ketosteroid isomerase-like protein
MFVVGVLSMCCSAAGLAEEADQQELLRLHEAVLAAHRDNDLDSWMQDESDDYVMVSRGEIQFPDKKERRAQLGPYLDSTTFHEYADLVEPQVQVSDDGTLGWVVAQVHIVGTRRMPDGSSVDFDDTWAWIELYEKRDGHWLRTGNVSNHKPE